MPGLLDGFMDDPSTMGLLGMAGGLLSAGGPSLAPHTLGQGLAAGLNGMNQGYNGVKQRLQDQQANEQNMQMNGLKIDGMKQQQLQQQAMLALQNRIKQRLGSDPQAAPSMAPMGSPLQDTPASAMPGGPMSPKIGEADWMQAYRQSQPQPAPQEAAQMPGMQSQGAGMGAQAAARLLREAQIRAEEGDNDGATKAYEAAIKLQPKYANEPRVVRGPDGKPMNVQMADDGTVRPMNYGVASELHFGDTGSNLVGQDKYTGGIVSSIGKSATPDQLMLDARARAQQAQSERHWATDRADANEPGKPNETLAKNIAAYKNAPLGQFNLNKSWGQATMDRVMELNPNYDAAQYAPRAASLRAYGAGGKEALAIDSVNIGMNHVAALRELALAQKTGNIQLFNKLANEYSKQTGQPAPTNLRMAADMVAPEIVKAVTGVAGTGEERAHFAQSLTGNGSYSPDQIIGATGEVQKLFAGRLSEKKRSYERSTQLDNFDAMLSPTAQTLLTPKDGGGGKTVSLSDIQATATASGKSTKEVTDAFKAKGYKIGGM